MIRGSDECAYCGKSPIPVFYCSRFKSDLDRLNGAFQKYSDAAGAEKVSCADADAASCGETSDHMEDFESGSGGGWSRGAVTDGSSSSSKMSKFLGRLGNGQTTEKTFSFNTGGGGELSFKFLRFESWDGETFTVHINGKLVASQSFTYNIKQTDVSKEIATGFPYTLKSLKFSNFVNYDYSHVTDEISEFKVILPKGLSTLTLKFGAGTNESSGNESWGIDDVKITSSGGHLAVCPVCFGK